MRIKNFNNFDLNENASQGAGNKFILMRFGNTPDMRVNRYFSEIALHNPKPFVMKGPGSIITFFQTALTKEALVQSLDQFGITYDLYQVVHTSAGGTGATIVAREKSVTDLKRELETALATDNFELAATLRDQIAVKEGRPTHAQGESTTESKVQNFSTFLLEADEVDTVEIEVENGITNDEFYKLISQLIDHELKEVTSEGNEGAITKEKMQELKDYLVQHNLYVAPEKEEGDESKPEGE